MWSSLSISGGAEVGCLFRSFSPRLCLIIPTLAVSMKLINILALFSTDFSVTIVAATHVLNWK